MKLYYATGTIAIAVAIALEEAGLPYDTHQLNFAEGAHKTPSYAKVNPKGRVPALDIDGTILTETGALLDYIATLAPDLMPTDPIQAAQARSVMYYLASTMHVNHAHKLRGHRWADNEASWQDMTASARFVEDNCLAGPFILGDRITIADAYLFMVCTWLPGDDVDLAPFPKIRAFMAAMEARDSVKTVRAKGMLR